MYKYLLTLSLIFINLDASIDVYELEAHSFTNKNNSKISSVSYKTANFHNKNRENYTYNIDLNNELIHKILLYHYNRFSLYNKLGLLYGTEYFHSLYYDKIQLKNIIYTSVKSIALKSIHLQTSKIATSFEKNIDYIRVISNANLIPELKQTYGLILPYKIESFNTSLLLSYIQVEDKTIKEDVAVWILKNDNIGYIEHNKIKLNTKFWFDSPLYNFTNYSHTFSYKKNDNRVTKATYAQMLNIEFSKLFLDEYLINTFIKYIDLKKIFDNKNIITIHSMNESKIYRGIKYDI